MPEGTTKESRCFVRGWACHARITPGYDTDMYDIGTLLKTSDQSRRIISMSEPRSSTRRFNGRTIVPGIMPSSPRSYVGRHRRSATKRVHPSSVQKGSGLLEEPKAHVPRMPSVARPGA